MPENQEHNGNSGAKLELPPGVTLLRTLERQRNFVRSAAMDPKGLRLATGGNDNSVRLWQTRSGQLLGTLHGHTGSVYAVAFDPRGQFLASSSYDQTVRVWDASTGEPVHTLQGHNDIVRSVAFEPGGATLASASDDQTIRLWEASSGKLLRTLEGHCHCVRNVAFDPKGGVLASGSDDKTVKLWDASSGKLLRTLEGHEKYVRSVAFHPKGAILASASGDRTVGLWEANSGKLVHTLNGHADSVDAIAVTQDGKLLASKSQDGTVRVWSCETWETLAVIPEPTRFDRWNPGLVFHPTLPLLVTVGSELNAPNDERCKLIHIWKLDLADLAGRRREVTRYKRIERTVHYVNAKVVLVGDTGVGKSGLAYRLVLGRFLGTHSSHARRAFILGSSTIKTPSGVDQHCETVLWDLAGQPAYRLVHQLAMEDAAVACVLFDARSETNPLEGAAWWSQALDQVRANAPIAKLLVPARMDVGGLPVSQERLQVFAQEHGFAGVFPTSAFTGEGCDTLLQAIRQHVHWEDLPAVSSTQTLATLRKFVGRLKGETGVAQASSPVGSSGVPPDASLGAPASLPASPKQSPHAATDAGAPSNVPPLLTIADLHRRFELDYGQPVPLDKFIAYLQRLEDTDTVDVLAFHSIGQEPKPETFVLLDPTRVDAYASALLVAAKDEPDGPGHLLESRVRNGDFNLPATERLSDKEAERHLSWFVMESLFSRDLALREKIKGEDYVVFPSQCTRELKFPGKGIFGVAYGFAGPVKNIYATLIAQLAHYEGFTKREFFQDAAAYRADSTGRCLVRLTDHANGTGELEVSFEEGTPSAVRQGFLEFVAKHLESRSKPGSVNRRHACRCANEKCQKPFSDDVVKARLQERKKNLLCPFCEKRTPLVDLLVAPTAASTAVAEKMDANAKAGRHRITAEWVIKSKETEGKYDVFLSHNSKDKPAVEEIARELKRVGIRPWLDKWDLEPGKSWVAALQKAIPDIGCAAIFFGPAGIGSWEQQEMEAFLVEFVAKGCSVLPVILPDAPKEPDLPVFLKTKTWVNLRDWKAPDSDAFPRLVCGILGKPPGDSPRGLSARHVWEFQKGRQK